MTEDTRNKMSNKLPIRSPLMPNRHPSPDFFVCDIFDASPKGDMASMEHPVFSLSTKPDMKPRRYEHNGAWIEIKPSSDGIATMHDRDILIYCISNLIAAMNKKQDVSQIIRFRAHDLLMATNRVTSGRGYKLLKEALDRLSGTRISTNITTGDQEITRGFGLIESYEIVRETRQGRMQEVEVKLSDWVYNAISSHEVLTLHRDYFRLRRPIERRLYELARKHCGRQSEWKISLETLWKKCGSTSTLREFKRSVTKITADDTRNNHLPDYSIRIEPKADAKGDNIVFRSRGKIPAIANSSTPSGVTIPPLNVDTFHDARLEAPGWDVYYLEQQWRTWVEMSDMDAPKKPDAAFIGFCRKWYEKRGAPT